MTLDYEPAREKPFLGFERDEFAYLAPMACFMAFLFIGTTWKTLYPWAYAGRTVCTAILLFVFWKRYTPIRWNYWWLGIIMGVLGIVQWIGMDTFLQPICIPIRLPLSVTHWFGMSEPLIQDLRPFALDPSSAFNPRQYFFTPAAQWSWIAVRTIGASLVVPVMEELFWRDYLWRRLIAPNDFKLAKVGEWDRFAFFAVAIAFCLVHPQWLTAIAWGLMVGGLLVYTKSLGACIIMHGVTNFLLALYVLKYQAWEWW